MGKYETVVAIDPGAGTSGIAFRAGEQGDCLAIGVLRNFHAVLDFARRFDSIILEPFSTAGWLDKYKLDTIRLSGALSLALGKVVYEQTPTSRRPYLLTAAKWIEALDGYVRLTKDHDLDATAHLVKWERDHGYDIPSVRLLSIRDENAHPFRYPRN